MPTTQQPATDGTTPTNPTNAGNVDEKSLLVAIEFKKIGNSKKVPGAKFTIDADKSLIRASKKLLDSAELKAISSLDGEIRKFMENHAVPSMFKSGIWRVPNTLVEEVYAALEQFAEQRAALVEIFVKAYPTLVENVQGKLRGVFNASDYKDEELVRAEFGFTWQFITFGVPETLKAIKATLFKKETEKTKAMFADANKKIQDLLRANMAEMVAHMVERLTPGEDGKPKTFHATMVVNMQDFLSTFAARNLTGDTELAALVEQASALVNGVDPEKLREGVDMRANIAAGFAKIKKALDKMVVLKPKRRIVFEEDGNATLPLEAEPAPATA